MQRRWDLHGAVRASACLGHLLKDADSHIQWDGCVGLDGSKRRFGMGSPTLQDISEEVDLRVDIDGVGVSKEHR